jgi:hypothetical protein
VLKKIEMDWEVIVYSTQQQQDAISSKEINQKQQ